MIEGVVNYELWQKCNRPNGRLIQALQLLENLKGEERMALAQHIHRCAELKLYNNNEKSHHRYLTAYEEDMIKSIMAGDTVDDFIRENLGRNII